MSGIHKIAAVAIAVKDLDAAVATYERLGFTVRERSPRGDMGIEGVILDLDGGMVELLAPADLSRPAAQKFDSYLDERGSGLYMLAVEVEDIDAKYAELQAAGVKVTGPPEPTPADSGVRGRFIWASVKATEGVLLEFIEFDR